MSLHRSRFVLFFGSISLEDIIGMATRVPVTQRRWNDAVKFLTAKPGTEKTTLSDADQRKLGDYRRGIFRDGMTEAEAARLLGAIGWERVLITPVPRVIG